MCRNCFSCSVVNADFVGAYTLFTVVLVYWRDGEIAVQPMSCYRTVSYQVLCSSIAFHHHYGWKSRYVW